MQQVLWASVTRQVYSQWKRRARLGGGATNEAIVKTNYREKFRQGNEVEIPFSGRRWSSGHGGSCFL